MANEVTDDPLDAAVAFAEALLSRPITGIKRTKRLVHADGTFEAHGDLAVEYQWECLNDPEHLEALAALRDGEEPSFGRPYEREEE